MGDVDMIDVVARENGLSTYTAANGRSTKDSRKHLLEKLKRKIARYAPYQEPIEHSTARLEGLGSSWNLLPDTMLLHVFSYLSEKDLCVCAQVSKVFRVFAEDEELWKPWVIKKHVGNFSFKGSWKKTALYPTRDKHPPEANPAINLAPRDFISTHLYQKWYRAHVDISNFSHVEKQQVERRSNLSLQEFIEEYDKKNKPVIITDALNHWRARTEWTKEKLIKRFEGEKFKTDEVDYPARQKLYMEIGDYFTYARTNHDEDPIYLFDDKFDQRENAKSLLDDYEVPVYFQEDFLQYLEEERPPFRWIVIGPTRSGSPFHVDPYRTAAWNALLVGRKRWALYPYNEYPPGVDIDWDEDGNFDSDSPEPVKWFLDTYPNIPEHKKPLECILEAGEVIFIPSGWWHLVLNLTDTIAVTQNFCNRQNFDVVSAEIHFDDEELFEQFQEKVTEKVPALKWRSDYSEFGPFKT